MSALIDQISLLKKDCYINGQWYVPATERRFGVFNPASGELLASVADACASDAVYAVDAAAQAFNSWSQTTAKERSWLLRRWFDLIMQHQSELAQLMTLECGKPLSESMAEVSYGASFVEWFSEEAKRAYGDVVPAGSQTQRIIVQKQPIGVCAAITPWNFPLAMITRKCAPAMAAGCTVVAKPAEATPLTALALAELADQAGIPAGVFNVVTSACGKEVGEVLSTDSSVKKVSFTGSTEVGRQLLKQCADTVKRTSMELGGNAPFIVFDDADLDMAIEGAVKSKYRNSGQTCVCANRFIVHESIAAEFTQRLAEESEALKVGNGLDDGIQQGPMINRHAVEKIETLLNDAIKLGAKIVTGGEVHELGGNYFKPTVVKDVSHNMRIAQEEIFGPVCPVLTFSTDDEAIAMANNTPYGLAAYFYTGSVPRSWHVSERLAYGMVGVNEGIISSEVAPFGGIKQSGVGREGGKYGLDEYLDIKYLCIGGL